MGLLCLALLFISVHCWPICGLSRGDIAAADTEALYHVLEVEIDATKRQLKLYQHKADLLNAIIKRIQSRHNTMHLADFSASSTATQRRRSRSRESPQIVSDWFEPQGTFRLSNGRVLTHLISFRPNTSPVGRRARRKPNTDDEPPLQFLVVLDRNSTVMSLFHPTTFVLMWQHALDLRSPSGANDFKVADMYFVSDRSAHMAILSTSGDLVLFKLRLWHNRRIVAGDPRRLKPLRELEESYLQCPTGQDSLHALNTPQPPWMQLSILTLTAPGKYLHVDVERVFGATLNHEWQYGRGKVAVVPLYYRVLVVAVDSSGGHLSFFHGDNGSFIEDIHTQISSHDGNVVQLEPIQSSRGLVALATQRQMLFVDATAPQSVPVVCKAPGRHTFSSVATDPLRPTIMYAGTSTGRAVVYKLHNLGVWRQRSEGEARSPVVCTLVDQLMPRRPQLPAYYDNLPAIVQTLPGFLVLGTGSRLMLYQLSGSSEEVQPTYLSERSIDDSFALELDGLSARYPQMLGISAAKDLITHSTGFAILVADANGSHRLDIYESRIPPPGTNLDLSWIRVPAMMICALAAMFWQQKGRLANSAGGKSAFTEAELAGLLSGRGGRLPSMSTMKRGGLPTNRRANDWY
ncbi:hypothetical protein PC129_g1276 [Phytophthora cactorum]|uniref:WD40-repeat-containing domain n=1 Tax=Phytophthora cactorum TaxID=29920 RepID=A0A329SPD5_9STRA|nr:hypothetical protein Pcac1_g23250 [Phytophthora cactorum]KAG2842446.1 hypothetical protein PC112_g2985 [Phytophthora cactorum]KAG2843585.1 hypothetical protein PC111_g2289 [Phytophthora cactorum]KAG2866156.1 hypothetical protein PC113_g3083 [Phytophthora cactorum]KAG2927056.1 hypothetical protein PC114_g3588 [Phytophthora cactorum]